MPPRLNDEELREIRNELHALQTQVALLTLGSTITKEEISEIGRKGDLNHDQILVIKTRIAVVASLIGSGAALAVKYLLH